MTEKGLGIKAKTGSYLTEPESWDSAFYDLGAICTYQLGLYEKSYRYAKIACEIEPNNPRLKRNLELIDLKRKEVQSTEVDKDESL